ncbi:MAG: hypothetical protein IT210_16320 [Armatimonadetes bacterium]|nr:hypothetical protein [Armatimonadota bacterium]
MGRVIYRGQSRSGLTLLEALYSMFLLGVVAIIFGSAFPMAILSRRMASERSQAASIASKQIEGLRGVGYKNLTYNSLKGLGWIDSTPTVSPFSFTSADSAGGDSVSNILPQGAGSIAISDAGADLREVTVTVRWRDRKNQQQEVSLTTLIHNL